MDGSGNRVVTARLPSGVPVRVEFAEASMTATLEWSRDHELAAGDGAASSGESAAAGPGAAGAAGDG